MNEIVTNNLTNANIVNFSFEEFFDTFQTSLLDISTFWLVNSGFCKEERKYAHVVLRACQIRPLYGPHLVSVFYSNGTESPEMRTFWVHSLTHLRRNLFLFEDRLSFERSTYLVPFEDGSLLIRLKSIRALISLPIQSPDAVPAGVSLSPRSIRMNNTVTDKMKSLLNHHIQAMVSYLNREMQVESGDSISILENYISLYFSALKIKVDS